MVSTHLKNISQIGNIPQVGVKIRHIWNHHLVTIFHNIQSYGLCKVDPFAVSSHIPAIPCLYGNTLHQSPMSKTLHLKNQERNLDIEAAAVVIRALNAALRKTKPPCHWIDKKNLQISVCCLFNVKVSRYPRIKQMRSKLEIEKLCKDSTHMKTSY